jgi:uncharacterized protein YigE (DUF2233 family)
MKIHIRFINRVSMIFLLAAVSVIWLSLVSFNPPPLANDSIIYHISDPQKEHIRLYWKNDKKEPILSLANLKSFIEKKHGQLIMAMNGGMYQVDHAPLGLYIEDGKTIKKLNQSSGRGNFYLKPNGVFYLTDTNEGHVVQTENFKYDDHIKWATQSGPMLLIDGKIHPEFRQGSSNLNVRNGVGIMEDGQIIFAISKDPINLFDFASFFLEMNCNNALYLDGSVSRMYYPSKNKLDLDGDFGVMIGVTTK